MDGGGDQRGWLALLHPVDALALLVADGFDREFHPVIAQQYCGPILHPK
jgi:hypothetical protein